MRLRPGLKDRRACSYHCRISLLASQRHSHRSRHPQVLGCISHGHRNMLSGKMPTNDQTSDRYPVTHLSLITQFPFRALNSPAWSQRIAVCNGRLVPRKGRDGDKMEWANRWIWSCFDKAHSFGPVALQVGDPGRLRVSSAKVIGGSRVMRESLGWNHIRSQRFVH